MMRRAAWPACRFLVVGAFCLLAILMIGRPSFADEIRARAEQVVRDLSLDIWANIGPARASGRRERLAEAVRTRTDVDALSRLALGKYWRRLDREQQDEYQRLFAIVAIDGLAARLDAHIGGLSGPIERHFRITGSRRAGKRDVLVRSKVYALAGVPLSVDWRLRSLDDRPVIIDLVIEGVSLLVSQRAEFAAVIERHRVEGLISALKARLPTPDS